MLKAANFVILLSLLTLCFQAEAARFGRSGTPPFPFNQTNNNDEDSSAGFQGRIPRPPEDEGEYERDPEEDYNAENQPASDYGSDGLAANSGGASNSRFGETINKIEFKLLSPEEEAHPKNPRAASYERYKKYRR
jgi:hypothetical protein